MGKKLLRIRIDRFDREDSLARDVFLFLPLNSRYLKLAHAGEELRAQLLAKLRARGHEALFIFELNEGEDAESVQLYHSEPPTESIQGSTSASENAQAFSNTSEADPKQPIAQPLETESTTTLFGDQEREVAFTVSGKESAGLDTETRIRSKHEEEEQVITIGSGDGQSEVSQRKRLLSAAETVTKFAHDLFVLREATQTGRTQAEQNFSFESIREQSGPVVTICQIFEATEELKVKITEADEADASSIDGEIGSLEALMTKVAQGRADQSRIDEKFSGEVEKAELAALLSGNASNEDLERVAEKYAKIAKRMRDRANDKFGAGIRSTALPLVELSENLAAGGPTESLLPKVRNAFLLDKISEEIVRVSGKNPTASEDDRIHLKKELEVLEEALRRVSSGDEPGEEVLTRFSSANEEADDFVTRIAAGDPDAMTEVKARVERAENKRAIAVQQLNRSLEEGKLTRSRTYRELPVTVSRLAAYLAYYLGYHRLDIVSDISLSAILHFARKDESKKFAESIPEFTQIVLDKPEAQEMETRDAREILQLLDVYIDDPDCDRSNKDLVKKIFDRSVQVLEMAESPVDGINAAQWSVGIAKGPNIDCHSLCTKASANALRQSKSIIL